jgi:hypothetical protein
MPSNVKTTDGRVHQIRYDRDIGATLLRMSAKELGEIHIDGDVLSTTYRGAHVRLRLAPDEGDRWRPVEVSVGCSEGYVHSEVIRTLPLRALEARANRGLARWVLEATQAVNGATVAGPTTHLDLSDDHDPKPRLRLSIPPGRGKKPDSFYEKVADAFTWLAKHSHAPAAELAERNGVPVTTVHRWVKEARARKILGSGERGRAT